MTQPDERNSDDPSERLRRAHSCLTLAESRLPGVYLEDLCFNAQQAVEKSLKALLVSKAKNFPFTHDIVRLNTELQRHFRPLPKVFIDAEFLSAYSVAARYPGTDEPVTEAEYARAVAAAQRVVEFIEDFLK